MMKREHCHAAAVEIRDRFIPRKGAWPERDSLGKGFGHLAWMVGEMGKPEMSDAKANRWLGYIQGALVWSGMVTLEEMKEINMKHAE